MAGLLAKDQIGVREQLADLMAVADMRANVLLPRIKKSRELVNPLFSWLVDNYQAPSTDAVVDGSDVSTYDNHAVGRARLYNQIHYTRRAYMVSRVAENVADVAGIDNEIAEMKRKGLKEAARDVESVLLGDQEMVADDGANGYKTRGLDKWIQNGAQATQPVAAAYRTPTAHINTTATASLTEDTDIQGMLKAIFDTTGMIGDYTVICGSTLRRKFTNMTRFVQGITDNRSAQTVRSFNADIAATAITQTTERYRGDFGEMSVVPSNFIGWTGSAPDDDRGYVLDMDKLTLRYNTMPAIMEHPDTGGGRRIEVYALYGLQVDNPLCLGKFKP